jgi:NodT family efflux transporter outer membrane factor (OMF) lipoprotein
MRGAIFRWSGLGLAGAFLILFGACAVGPDYIRPPVETPTAYKEEAGWKVAEPREELPRGRWWEIYDDPQLNALEEEVEISNQSIAAAESNFRQAVALIQVAGAAYFPVVTGGAAWSRSKRSQDVGTTKAPASTLADYIATFNAAWEPDLWGKVRRSVESSTASAQASAATVEGIRLSVQATLAQSYFLLRALDEEERILNDTVAAYQEILDVTKNRYAVGVASRAAVLQAETQLKTTAAEAIDLGVQRAQLEHAIAILVGKAPADFSIPPAPVPLEVPVIPVGVPSDLLERRPDVAGAEREMAAANAQIGVALAAYYPTVPLTAAGGFEASTAAAWFNWPSGLWALGAATTETVFEGGLRRAQTETARAAYDSTLATYRQTVLTAFQEVEDNLAALRILEQEAKVQDEAVKAARESVQVSTNQYNAGTISHLELMVVETAALDNERTATTILANRMSASTLLIKALGGGWKSADLPGW